MAALSAYAELQDDGLLDILLGGLLILFGIAEGVEGVGGPAGAVWIAGLVVLVGGFVLGRRFVTQPRVGWIGSSTELRRRKTRAAIIGMLILVVGTTLFYVVTQTEEGLLGLEGGAAAILVLGVTMLAFFGALSVTLKLPRLWFYGVIYGIPLPVGVLLAIYADVRIHPLILVGLPALVAVVYGIVLLRRFLERHPSEPAQDAGVGAARAGTGRSRRRRNAISDPR